MAIEIERYHRIIEEAGGRSGQSRTILLLSAHPQMTVLPLLQVQQAPRYVATSARVAFAQGFYQAESDGTDTFRWMGRQGRLEFEAAPVERYLEFSVLSEFRDLSQHLIVASTSAESAPFPLVAGWSPMSVPVPAGVSAVDLRLDKVFPKGYYPSDPRLLGVRVRHARLHEDEERHAAIARQYANSVLNQREVLAGQVALTSTPPSLGIDLHGACNVKPPCVYCEWDFSKTQEGDHVDVPFTRDTLREWGPFFDNSVSLINCSIGEPFMMKNLDDLLDVFGRTGKALQMTTNGQILTERNIQKIVGQPIDLYVSLDAATAETYAKLRNTTWERLIGNLRRLVAAKGGRGRPPFIHLVFMPMKVNVHELEAFVRLAADLQVDRMVLRPLNYSDSVALNWDRAGHHFEYKNELLPFKDLVAASARAARLCRELGVELADQMDFGGKMSELFGDSTDEVAAPPGNTSTDPAPPEPAPVLASAPAAVSVEAPAMSPVEPAADSEAPLPSLGGESSPACLEPWKSLYILRRGVLPCCYGGEPVAPMEEFRTAWNSPLLQDIRRELLHGRFHDYCLKSAACPIVRKNQEAALLPARQRARMAVRRAWTRLNRDTGNWPNEHIYLPLRRAWQRARRIAAIGP
jgi:MoaA/NifB/PqqE/SkfB family radical SAM enzyme